MSETLKELIAKLKAKEQNKGVPQETEVKNVKTSQEIGTETEEIEEPEEDIEEQEKTIVMPSNQATEPKKKTAEEIEKAKKYIEEREMLQNNGIFRIQLLQNLNEINQALFVIAKSLVNLVGSEDKRV